LFCTKFCTLAKSKKKKEKELRPSQKVFLGKNFKSFARKSKGGKKEKEKIEFTTFRLFGPTGSLKNSRIPKNI